ncbi:hypothetical protein [Arenimonas donghaensis]|uniref:Uncharacterized protein n=1 Tax=Arenimonas donghaensis DSM 18148 = HO3-R19 TaxID=1121014 RepID=A0A087MJL0_9GAMM|nr:hypothetical protein [Arenimonas donghaensis]KFL37063.1 hypothetical protein N788_11090 [Arenimonas donghaensis DSM 18148 = HO3-R19]
MTPGLRKTLPFLAPLLVGALAYFAVGKGPSSAPERAGDAMSWQLPTIEATDTTAAATLWSARSPWGSDAAASPEAPVVTARPVGVVAVGDRLFALFTQGDAVVRVAQDESLAEGGTVTAIHPDRVEWVDAAGTPQSRELLVDIVDAAPDAAPDRRGGNRTSNRAQNRVNNRATQGVPQREPGQRRARQTVPNSGSDQFKSRRPSSTGG